MKKNKKILIIGMDGSRLDIIEKWIKEGYLPNLKKLIQNGVSGDLRTIFPPHSMLAWTSFMTGRNPGKHGIYNAQLQVYGTYKLFVPNLKNIQTKTIFDYVSDNRKNVISVNIPMTYPPKKINGIMISSWLTPPFSTYVYPPNLQKKLKEIGYKISPESVHRREKNFVNDVYEATEKRVEATKYLMKKYDWDLTALLINGTEHMHHNFSSFLDKNHPEYHPSQEKTVRDYYSFVDEKIGELLDCCDKETIVFVMSDHGFCPSYGKIYLNNLLKKYGYFKEKKKFNLIRFVFRWLESSGTANKLRNKVRVNILPSIIQDMIKEKRVEGVGADWNKTKAYCTGVLGDIRINLKGREPNGIVSSEEYDKLRQDIIRKLSNDNDVKHLVKKIYKREEIYNGPFLNRIPDLYVEFKKCFTTSVETPDKKVFGTREQIGFHTMDGVFVIYGRDIKKDRINANIMDIAPTVLHILDVPVPEDMDGKVLKKVFKKSSDIGKEKVRYSRVVEKEREKIRSLVLERRI